MRINARLDQDHSQKLEYLKRVTGANISVVIKEAIDAYYHMVTSKKRSTLDLLVQSNFIGSGESDENLSENYKELLSLP